MRAALVSGESPELEQLARSVASIKPNFSYQLKDIASDVSRIFNTGYGPPAVARHVIGCHFTRETRVQTRWMTWHLTS
jgi:hypothetical protein